MHLTLKFLGDVREENTADVCRVVSKTAAEFEPFDIALAGRGFPECAAPAHAVDWRHAGEKELIRLQTAVERALANAVFPKSTAPFIPI